MASLFGSSELNSPIGARIRAATDAMQLTVDWATFMDIIDMINQDQTDNNAQLASRALVKRFQETEQNLVNLSLLLSESIMKNCSKKFAPLVDKSFMDELSLIAKGSKGSKNADDSRRIIQLWGVQFAGKPNLSIFNDTYVSLRSQGISFPPLPTPIAAEAANQPGSQRKDSVRNSPNAAEFDKLNEDLAVVCDQIKLCREMLPESPGIEHDEILSEVIGYLEACKDRMMELIEAGTQGLLGESLFAKVLLITEYVNRTLDAERVAQKEPINDDFNSYNPRQGAATQTKAPSTSSDDVDLLGVGMSASQISDNPVPPPAVKSPIKLIAPPPHKQT